MLDWKEIDTVLLDMDGTLLDLHFDNHFWVEHLPRRYAERHGMALTEAAPRLRQAVANQQGTLNWYCLDFWSRTLELDIVGLKREVAHLIALRGDTVAFLQRLATERKQRILITNAHRDSLDLKLLHTRLDQHLDALYSAHDFGQPKEQPTLWQSLQQVTPFDPARTLLIDDKESVLRSAQQFGIRHLITIAQPDSQQPPRDGLAFPAIEQFSALW